MIIRKIKKRSVEENSLAQKTTNNILGGINSILILHKFISTYSH